MQNKEKVALFDFCETIANFQTADAFVEFLCKRNPDKVNKGFSYFLQKFLVKTKLSSVLFHLGFNFNKRLVLLRLRGVCKELVEAEGKAFYNSVIKANFIDKSIEELNQLKKKGYSIYIVSGGYDAYLQYFAKDYDVDLICSKISYFDNLCTGKLSGADCMGHEKVARLTQTFHSSDIKNIDSISFSDSISDLPLLQYTRRAIVVTKKEKDWINRNNFEILLWQK